MHNKNIHIDSFSQCHEVLLDNLMGTGVVSAAVTKHDQCAGIGIMLEQMVMPYPLDVVADKPGSVVACADCHVSLVSRNVVNAMGDNLAVGEGLEIMVKRFWSTHTQCLPVPLEIAYEFFFLGVDADYRQTDLPQKSKEKKIFFHFLRQGNRRNRRIMMHAGGGATGTE